MEWSGSQWENRCLVPLVKIKEWGYLWQYSLQRNWVSEHHAFSMRGPRRTHVNARNVYIGTSQYLSIPPILLLGVVENPSCQRYFEGTHIYVRPHSSKYLELILIHFQLPLLLLLICNKINVTIAKWRGGLCKALYMCVGRPPACQVRGTSRSHAKSIWWSPERSSKPSIS
jgi:hypothetical protein